MGDPPHAKLAVYERAIEALAALEQTARWIPSARDDLREQLRRASASIVLNLAEGAAEFSPAEKSRFYRIARRSAAECLAALDVLAVVAGPPPDVDRTRHRLNDVMAMTTRLIQSTDARRK